MVEVAWVDSGRRQTLCPQMVRPVGRSPVWGPLGHSAAKASQR